MNKIKTTVLFIFILIISINSNYSVSYDLKPHHLNIAEELFSKKKPLRLKDINDEMIVYALNDSQYESFCRFVIYSLYDKMCIDDETCANTLNDSQHESFCYFVICSLYDRILKYYNNVEEDNQEKLFAELNKKENYILLYDFLNSVLLNKRTDKNFKTSNMEIREGYEQNYKCYSIKFGDLSTGQFVFNFDAETLPTTYQIWKQYYDKMPFVNMRKQEESGPAIFAIQAAIYCSISMYYYPPGIFYDRLFQKGKEYKSPHE